MPYFEQGMFLERYPVCRWDYGLFGKVPLGTEWHSGWIGKVPEVRCGLERYLICGKVPEVRVRYGTACLLIRGTVGSIRCTYS
jgi:hypothetical protein